MYLYLYLYLYPYKLVDLSFFHFHLLDEFMNDDGKYGESYISVEQLIKYGSELLLYGQAEWRDRNKIDAKCKLDIYLSYISTIGATKLPPDL